MHLVTLTFDDGFRQSCETIARIYERHGLSASFNVVATAHRPDFIAPDRWMGVPLGDFVFWNEMQSRGHEVMPHGYRHANKTQLPFAEGRDLIQKCLDIFTKELRGFDATKSIFNFPYNATTPELEAWLPTVVRAFRGGARGINPLPHAGLTKLATTGFGPGNCDEHLESCIKDLLAQPSGWLLYTAHGMENEGWGPMSARYLEALIERLVKIPTVKVVAPGKALRELSH